MLVIMPSITKSVHKPPLQIVVDLPRPPSVNRLWRVGRKRVYRSKAYLDWIRQADACWLMQKQKAPVKQIHGFFQAEIIVVRPDKRRRDNSNLPKALYDFCERIQVIDDDCMDRDTRVRDGDSSEAPLGIRIIIKPLDKGN